MTDDLIATNARKTLQALFDNIRAPDDGIAETCRTLASQLGNQVHPKKEWGWQYIHQVLHGKIRPSRNLMLAIGRLQQRTLVEPHPDWDFVLIRAPKGFVQPKTLVTIPAKKCSLPTCNHSFLPSNPNHRFCSPDCRKLAKQ